MTELSLSQMILALHAEPVLADWERDFVAVAYASSAAGTKPFHLSVKQIENVKTIFDKVYAP